MASVRLPPVEPAGGTRISVGVAEEQSARTSTSAAMAYVLLPDCQVLVSAADGYEMEVGKWKTVTVAPKSQETTDSSQSKPTAAPIHEDGPCRVCELVLEAPSSGGDLNLCMNDIMPFDGVQSSVTHKACRRPRSDASLLLGLLRTVQEHVAIYECQILFRGGNRAALLVTLSFPLLMEGQEGCRSILTSSKRKVTKPLPAAHQLLLSMVRSDWRTLEETMQVIEADPETALLAKRKLAFFPEKLTVEQLYLRIPGSSGNKQEGVLQPCQTDIPQSYLLDLPKDLLIDNIAPFLEACSLDNLRRSCTALHESLRAVVPGLKLDLYRHQVNSLAWMRERETRPLYESDCLVPSQGVDGDLHRAATGGLTVLLQQRKDPTAKPVRLLQWSGREVSDSDMASLPRAVARGGLLCDSPGLGKTITVLALALQTFGLSTTKSLTTETMKDQGAFEVEAGSDEDIFRTYWRDVTSDFRKPLLNKLLNDLLRGDRGGGFFPVDRLRKEITSHGYGSGFEHFEVEVQQAIGLYAPDDETKSHSRQLLGRFRAVVAAFKQRQMRSANKSFSNSTARPNSRVAAIIEQQSHQKHLNALIPSSGSLFVIPSVLMEHWQSQIEMHVDTRYLSRKKPMVFDFGKSDKGAMTVDKATILCELHKTHFPFVFLDRGGTRPLPSAQFLARFCIVITTTDRFKRQWSSGSFQKELERASADSTGRPAYMTLLPPGDSPEEACPLLKVHWLRMVVDEGHSMGKGSLSSTIQFASWVAAERRWAMTGTPTKQAATAMNQLRGLMTFLGHEFFTARLEGERSWRDNISRPWRSGSLAPFFRLQSLLGLLMKRHTKLDIAELEPPRFERRVVPMSFVEVMTYNTLASGVQMNILLTSMKGKTSGKQDSLLHRSQAKHAREALGNIRRVCVGWSRVIPTLRFEYFMETVYLLNKHGIDEPKIESIREYLLRPEKEELTSCACCSLQLSTLILLPCCACLVCTECMDNRSHICVVCDKEYDVDDLQRLQPGFELMWKSNLEASKVKKLTTPTPAPDQAPAPLEIDHNQANAHEILIRPAQARARTKRFGDGHECQYDRFAADGKCILCHEEHNFCKLIQSNAANAGARCSTCHRVAQECPEDESKGSYLVRRLENLYHLSRNPETPIAARFDPMRPQDRPLKALVFSQFRQALNVVGDRLLKRFGAACVAEYWGRYRTEELHKFVHDKDCFCMLLGKDGSEGLDLSFVTHIFFLEELWDKSLQDQAVARAWRMGAKGRVDVETLIARNSVEETMEEIESALQEDGGQTLQHIAPALVNGDATALSAKDYQHTKTQFLLRSLRLVTDYHQFSSGDSGKGSASSASSPMVAESRKRSYDAVEDNSSSTEPRRSKVRFAL